MELQYAILCEKVKLPTPTDSTFLLSQPVTSFTVKRGSPTWRFPLVSMFINCGGGERKFTVEVSNFDGEVISVKDITLKCFAENINCFNSSLIDIPVQKTDLLTLTLYLDGIEQRKIKLPIKVEYWKSNPASSI